ncbi:MAG: Gfo/Idh/MocA family oxidoreductase [Lentisphaeria bacterium]|nr:Gfo/Idh/MocA family oxidoreductase [Lentisphaeria bacterium]
MKGRPIGIAVVGMGWMGFAHSRAYCQLNDRYHQCGIRPQLIVCADPVEARAAEGKSRFGFQRATTDWRDAVTAEDVQVVVITTPNDGHLQIVEAAAAAGKHITCEKPMGRTPHETARCYEAVQQAGTISGSGFNYRWVPVLQHARQLIADGALGDITHCRARYLEGYAQNADDPMIWRFDQEIAGLGATGDMLSHATDLVLVMAGPIHELVAHRHTFIPTRPVAGEPAQVGQVTNEDYASALIVFENGARGTLETCRVIKGPKSQFSIEVHGTRGALSWDFERMNEMQLFMPDDTTEHDGYVRIISGPDHRSHEHFTPAAAHGLGYEDLKVIESYEFLQTVVDGRQGDFGFNAALAVAEVHDAMGRSWESGGWEQVRRLTC